MLIPNTEYSGPFANEKEHLFYTNIPNLSQFVSSSKQSTKPIMNVEKELSLLEMEGDDLGQGVAPFESSSESEDEPTESNESSLIQQVLLFSSAEDVDQVALLY